jgi:hypothetical protein
MNAQVPGKVILNPDQIPRALVAPKQLDKYLKHMDIQPLFSNRTCVTQV